jgi:superfamily I DNA/RNA helicase
MEEGCDMEDKYNEERAKRKHHVEKILNSKAQKKIVVAGPGTGKTWLFKEMLEKKRNCLTLTFVNDLVEDLCLELNGLSQVKTLHSFALGMLREITKKNVKVFPKLSKVIREDAKILIKEEIDFNKIFNDRDDENKHIEFYRKRKKYYGDFYGYSDIVWAMVKYLEHNRNRVPCYSQIVVDEFQDFNELEVSLIDLLSEQSPILLTGDDDQALYAFKSASPGHIRHRYSEENPDYEPFDLPFCSRCTQVIVEAANDIVKAAMEKGFLKGRVAKRYNYFHDEEKDIVSEKNPKIVYAQQYSAQIPWFIEKQIREIAKDVRSKFSVLIIPATNTQCSSIARALKGKGFESIEYVDKRAERDLNLLDGLKLLLENEEGNLGWRIASWFLLGKVEFERLLQETSKEGATDIHELVGGDCRGTVKDMIKLLKKVKNDSPVDENSLDLLKKMGFNPFESVKAILKEELGSDSKGFGDSGIRKIPIKVTTVQRSKGLAEDCVFITHFDDQYFVRKKEEGISDDDICSFLVGLTRAKKRVFLISSQKKDPTFLGWIKEERIERL